MKCFNHTNNDSVGMCRICGKALCKECAVSGTMGITCVGKCQETAQGMGTRMAQADQAQKIVKKFSAFFVLITGILIGILALTMGGDGLIRYIFAIPAIALIVWGVILLLKNKKGSQAK